MEKFTPNLTAIEPYLDQLNAEGSTDLLLVGGATPRRRLDGNLEPIPGAKILSGPKITAFVRGLLTPEQRETFALHKDVDFALSWRETARLRCSAFVQRGETALAIRFIPQQIPTFDELGIPLALRKAAELPQGLVLVTGPTGVGKSTTLAAVIEKINETRAVAVLSIEDPIEFVHVDRRATILQREVGRDTPSFERALRASLREDPDVLLIGELRDMESMAIALTLAETWHLVFATLHTNVAPQAIDRLIDAFPEGRHDVVRSQIASTISLIASQRLVRRQNGGRTAAFEVLVGTPPVKNLIRDGRSNQIANLMRTGQRDGMCTLEMSLADLVRAKTVTLDEALSVSVHPDEVLQNLA